MPPYKIAISTIYTSDWQEIIDIVSPNLEIYCNRHGYDMFLTKYERGLKDFDKIRWLLDAMKWDYDFIWQLDADAVITNHKIRIEEFIDSKHDLFICKDINSVNCGSFIIRNTEWSEWLLAWMLDLEGVAGNHCEQDALNEYLQSFPNQVERRVKFLEHPAINSYQCNLYKEYDNVVAPKENWVENDFVLHLPGIGMEQRVKILNEIKITT